MPPARPRKREPNTKERLTMFGPGRKWQSAKVSLNSSAVIHLCSSTMPRRAQTNTPPKPASDILANATNSAIRLGGDDVSVVLGSATGTVAGGESGSMAENLEHDPEKWKPVFPPDPRECVCAEI